MKVIVDIPEAKDRRKKAWRKALCGVDISKTNGYAFEGNFLRCGEKAELPVNSYVLAYDEAGSTKNWYINIRLFKIMADASLEEVLDYSGEIRQYGWALAVRDQIAEILAGPTEVIELTAEEQQLLNQLKSLEPERLNALLAGIK